MNGFRMKLNLSKFFNDVRVSAFIFVSSDIETIGDLQKHISKLFNISDELALLCDNHFLPAGETVKILKEDEVITVIEGSVRKVKKVKKRKIKEDDSFCDLDLTFNIEKQNDSLEEVDINLIEPVTLNKQRKKKQQISESRDQVRVVEDSENRQNDLCELPELARSVTGTLRKQKKHEHINGAVDEEKREFSFKSSVLSHRKKVEPMPISTVAKVIKSVVVSDDKGWHPEPVSPPSSLPLAEPPTDTLLEDLEQMDTSEMEPPIIVKEVEVRTQDKIIKVHSNKKLTTDPEIITKLQDESEAESKTENESLNDTNSSVSTKSKRKRVRKRRSKSKTSKIEVIPTPVPVFRTTSNVKNVHIKFDDDLNPTVLSVAAKPVSEEMVGTTCGKMKQVAPSCTKVERVSPLGGEVVETIEKEGAVAVETISLVVNTAECRKEILSYPIMETKPKVNDIIAFKKYVLSKNYTPEISDFIIAQVNSFDVMNQELALDILEGGEQCVVPNGKFCWTDSLDEPEDVNKIEMKWCEMIEPRLIYP